jgi:serine/threonine protein kinase
MMEVVSEADDLRGRSWSPRVIGQYEVHDVLGAGGMATVHFGRKLGPAGFAKLVAVKRLHPGLAQDQEFVTMFLDEARITARLSHPNIATTLDVQVAEGELLLAMEYVHGEALHVLLANLRAESGRTPPSIAARILADVLAGLHAAHEATGERGAPLEIVHRDVSPHNVLVGVDGVARIIDFGVAKATERAQVTRDGKVKGKLRYMSPEQAQGEPVDRRTDVYGAGVLLWELLTGRRFLGAGESSLLGRVVSAAPEAPSTFAVDATPLDALTLRALAKSRDERFSTAQEMAGAVEAAVTPAGREEVAAWVRRLAAESLAIKEERRRRVEDAALDGTATGTSGGRAGRLRALPGDVPTRTDHLAANREEGSLGAAEHPIALRRSRRPAVAVLVTLIGLGVAVAAGFQLRGGSAARSVSSARSVAPPPPPAHPLVDSNGLMLDPR